MSGGSYSYIYSKLLNECYGAMYDAEMNDMIKDLAEVLHDLEWWQSADSSEDKYRATLARFKAKWFKDNRKDEQRKQMQKYESKQLIDELSKMPPMVIATAYVYAKNYVMYGEDITKAWTTAVQNASALEKAYRKGYYDALQKQAESEE